MTTIIILIVLLILALVIIPFSRQLILDKEELHKTPINEKFKELVTIINNTMLNGEGEITLFDNNPRLMNLMSDNMRNMLIQFYYSTGNLTIILNYKYFQKELVHKEVYNNLRNITIFTQKDIARSFIEVCNKKIMEHQQMVMKSQTAAMPYGSENINIEGDTTSFLAAPYKSLSLRQKRSVVNLLYIIAKHKGLNDNEIRELTSINQQAVILNLRLDDCKRQLIQDGNSETSIVNDLKGIDEGCMSSIILSVIQLLHDLANSLDDFDTEFEEYVNTLFEQMGYSQQRVENIIKKINLLGNMFSL